MEKSWEEQRTGAYLNKYTSFKDLPNFPPILTWNDGWCFANINYGKDMEAKKLAIQARDLYYKK